MSGGVRLSNNRTNRRDSSTFVFVTRVHVIVYVEGHLSVFGTEMINSDKRSIDISDTL